MAQETGKVVNLRITTADMSSFARSLSCLRIAVLAAAVFLVCSSDLAQAGSQIGELAYRYKCRIDNRVLDVTYKFRDQPETVGISLRDRDTPVLVVNERESFEQPFEVVAFEYFSACEQARKLIDASRGEQGHLERFLADPNWTRKVVFRSDCDAIAQMRREGLLGGARGFQRILGVFLHERAKMDYFHVSFRERADNLRNQCPF